MPPEVMEDPATSHVHGRRVRRHVPVAAFVLPAIMALGPSLPPATAPAAAPAGSAIVDDLAALHEVLEGLHALEPCDD